MICGQCRKKVFIENNTILNESGDQQSGDLQCGFCKSYVLEESESYEVWTTNPIRKLHKAVAVIINDFKLKNTLFKEDPKAYDQLQDAFMSMNELLGKPIT